MTTTRLRYGLYLPAWGPLAEPAVLIDLAVRAEAAGWDGLFLWEHTLADGPLPVTDPWVALGALATATSRILLGTMVTPLSRRRPWVVARQAGTVSRLSGGRCVLGVGIGADDHGDFSRFGEAATVRERAARTDEGLAVIRALWAGTPYSNAGPHHRVDLPEGTPEPHRIPVWVAGTLPALRSAPRAARHDGLVLLGRDGTATPANVELARAALPADRPFDIVLCGNTSTAWADAPRVDLSGMAAAGLTWWLESLMHWDPLDLTHHVVDAGPEAIRAASRSR